MEESPNDEPIQETQEEKSLDDLRLPNEIWAQILDYTYSDSNCFLNLVILDEANDVYEAINSIEKYISKQLIAIPLTCRIFRNLSISKKKLLKFKQKIREIYIPYLNEKFLEKHDGEKGLYPKMMNGLKIKNKTILLLYSY